jgi:hypothetical protein
MTDTLKAKMLELLKQNRKREYLDLCKHNYIQAVSIIQKLFPELYVDRDPFDSLYDKAMENKKQGNTEGEIQILETAIASLSAMPYCYERLSVLYSKANNHKKAYAVCMQWFDSDFWNMPNSLTTSLKLLDRLEKLKKKNIDRASHYTSRHGYVSTLSGFLYEPIISLLLVGTTHKNRLHPNILMCGY